MVARPPRLPPVAARTILRNAQQPHLRSSAQHNLLLHNLQLNASLLMPAVLLMGLVSVKERPSPWVSSLYQTGVTQAASASAPRSPVAPRRTDVERLEAGASRGEANRRSQGWCPMGSVATSPTASATQRLASKRLIAQKPRVAVCQITRLFLRDFLFYLASVVHGVSAYTFL